MKTEINVTKFRVPVMCQNGHKSFYFYKLMGIGECELVLSASDHNKKCRCPKWELEDGWKRNGSEQFFTGLKDQNGNEIYEGDILLFPTYSNHPTDNPFELNNVEFKFGSFYLDEYQLYEFEEECDDIEIKGNIYENSELLR